MAADKDTQQTSASPVAKPLRNPIGCTNTAKDLIISTNNLTEGAVSLQVFPNPAQPTDHMNTWDSMTSKGVLSTPY